MDPRGVKVVVRYADGRFTKGKTYDFQVGRPRFHVFADPRTSDALPVRVDMSDLKAVFFVRDLAGPHTDRGEFPENRPMGPRSPFRVAVTFRDGEVLIGTTEDPPPRRVDCWSFPRTRSPTIFGSTSCPRRSGASASWTTCVRSVKVPSGGDRAPWFPSPRARCCQRQCTPGWRAPCQPDRAGSAPAERSTRCSAPVEFAGLSVRRDSNADGDDIEQTSRVSPFRRLRYIGGGARESAKANHTVVHLDLLAG
jgi:uncharacterized protein DUF6982